MDKFLEKLSGYQCRLKMKERLKKINPTCYDLAFSANKYSEISTLNTISGILSFDISTRQPPMLGVLVTIIQKTGDYNKTAKHTDFMHLRIIPEASINLSSVAICG